MDTTLTHFSLFFQIGTILFFAVLSPGPDFILMSRISLLYSQSAVRFTALGVAISNMLHFLFAISGISLLILRFPGLYLFMQFIGALYLAYLGVKMLLSEQNNSRVNSIRSEGEAVSTLSSFDAFKAGFLTNLLNPKAFILFLSIVSQIVKPETALYVKTLLGLEIGLVVFVTFYGVGKLLSVNQLKSRLQRYQNRLEKCFGILLIGIASLIIL